MLESDPCIGPHSSSLLHLIIKHTTKWWSARMVKGSGDSWCLEKLPRTLYVVFCCLELEQKTREESAPDKPSEDAVCLAIIFCRSPTPAYVSSPGCQTMDSRRAVFASLYNVFRKICIHFLYQWETKNVLAVCHSKQKQQRSNDWPQHSGGLVWQDPH